MNGGVNQIFHKNFLTTSDADTIAANFVYCRLNNPHYTQVTMFDECTYAVDLQSLKGVKKNKAYSFMKSDILNTVSAEKLLQEHTIDTMVYFSAGSKGKEQ